MGLFRTLRRGAFWLAVGGASGALLVTARHLLETPQPLESGLPGEGRIDRKHGGDIYFNVAGPAEAQPLVLLHDFYPGASSFEFRRIFPRLAERYRVYAPDWLGFGMSEHPAVAYTGEFYASVLTGYLRDVVGQPAIVLAHGRAANIAVRAASDTPELFDRLVLVAPEVFAGVATEPTLPQMLVQAARRASLGLVPYALVSTRPALRWISSSRSRRGGPDREEEVEHLYASAHQFGGQYALLAMLTGDLDLAMPNAFALLEPPVLIVSGERDRQHPRVDMEDIAILNPHADLEVIPSAADVVFEDQPDLFLAALTRWLETPASRHTLDESALLPAEPEETARAEDSTGLTDITGEATETGAPGSVVPGVSDAGQEGPAAADVGGIATVEQPTVSLGPEEAAPPDLDTVAGATAGALLPEAGDTEQTVGAERAARGGSDAPTAPAENMADREAEGVAPEGYPPAGEAGAVLAAGAAAAEAEAQGPRAPRAEREPQPAPTTEPPPSRMSRSARSRGSPHVQPDRPAQSESKGGTRKSARGGQSGQAPPRKRNGRKGNSR
jgi:pimeloyl-ACP methyl ester carboxylesterase